MWGPPWLDRCQFVCQIYWHLIRLRPIKVGKSVGMCRLPDLLVLWKISDKWQGHAIAFHHLSLKGFKVCCSAESVEINQTQASVIKLLSYKLASVPWRSAGISAWFNHLGWITGPQKNNEGAPSATHPMQNVVPHQRLWSPPVQSFRPDNPSRYEFGTYWDVPFNHQPVLP